MKTPEVKKPLMGVVVIGAGGNIGSHLVPHLGRMPGVGRVTLIDRDVYEPHNLKSQDITEADIGRKKVKVQAQRLCLIDPGLEIETISVEVQRLPLGKLRSDVILACLDSRRARQYVNQVAWRLGIPWIDAGVESNGLLARVNVYVPGEENPCLECAWGERDYENLEQIYPCSGELNSPSPTNAPSGLGSLAASLQAIECMKLLDGGTGETAAGRQVLIDATHHKHYVTQFERNPRCRFSDHAAWAIHELRRGAEDLTLQKVFKLAGEPLGSTTFRVEGKYFLRKLICPSCGWTRSLLRLATSLGRREWSCRRCRHPMVGTGFDMAERLEKSSLAKKMLGHSLHRLGLRSGEVFSVHGPEGEKHFEITGDSQ